MLQDLDKTIQSLLVGELPELADRVHFETPFDDYAMSMPSVNLFLYDVREHRELRSGEWRDERQGDGSFLRRRPPVRVACAYLITAWAADIADEHRLLGEVMRALLRYPRIPTALLVGELRGPSVPTTALQASNLQSLGEFWQGMRGKPRAALAYTVTISVDAGGPPETLQPVEEQIIRIRPGVEGP